MNLINHNIIRLTSILYYTTRNTFNRSTCNKYHISIRSYISTDLFFLDKDLNECKKYENLCAENAQCRNTVGSYKCVCIQGYHADGQLCVKGMERP